MNARAGRIRRAVAAAVFAAIPVLVAIPAGSASARSGVWVKPTTARRAAAFWTPARMRAAKPIEVFPRRGEARATLRRGRRGEPGRVAAFGIPGPSFGADFEQVPDPTLPEFRVNGAL